MLSHTGLKETAFRRSRSGHASFESPLMPTYHAFGTSNGKLVGISPIFAVSKNGRKPSGNIGDVHERHGNPPRVQLPVRASQSRSLQSDSHSVPLQPKFSNRHPCWEYAVAEALNS